MQPRMLAAALALAFVSLLGCPGKPADDPAKTDPGKTGGPSDPGRVDPTGGRVGEKRFAVVSPTMVHRGAIDAVHTCDGAGSSPELNWDNVPEGTLSFVLIAIDSDVPKNFSHWVVWNIPADARSLRAALPGDAELAELGGARQGLNDFGKHGWGAPCPPAGPPHRFVFRIYALDALLDLPAGAKRADLEEAMKGHYRGQAGIIASYARQG